MRKLLQLALIFLLAALLFAAQALGTTYYVDNSATGCGGSGCSNANARTSKSTAWLDAPDMVRHPTHMVTAGDFYVFKGGDSWLSAVLPITVSASGVVTITLAVTQAAGGGDTVTWSSVKWPGGIAPVMSSGASAVDIYSFKLDGTNVYGMAGQNFE
jgi:hypothetical protein